MATTFGLPRLKQDYYARNPSGDFQSFYSAHPTLQQAIQGKHDPVNFYGNTFGAKTSSKPGQTGPTPPPEAPTAQAPEFTYDYSADPILQQINALGHQSLANAEAAALKGKQQAAVAYGDADLARSLGLGDTYAQAAADNPFSTLADLKQNYQLGVRGLENDLNKQNLFYGTYRGDQLGLADRLYQEQQAKAADAVQNTFSQIGAALLQAQQEDAMRRAQAESDAAGRAIQEALLHPQAPAEQAAQIHAPGPPAPIKTVQPPKKVRGFGKGTVTNKYRR